MCERIREQLASYVAGTLPPAAEHAVVDHLAHCPACRAEAASWAVVAAAVRRRARARVDGLPTYRSPAPAETERARSAGALGAATAFGRARRHRLRLWGPRIAAGLTLAAGIAGLAVLATDSPGREGRLGDGNGPTVVEDVNAPQAMRRLATPVTRRAVGTAGADRPGTAAADRLGPAGSTESPARGDASPAIGRVAAAAPQFATSVGDGAPAATWPTATLAPETSRATVTPAPDEPSRPEPTQRARETAPPAAPPATGTTPEHPTATPEAPMPTPVTPPATSVPTIAGTVHDANAAPLAGARVLAEPASGGPEVGAETDALGRYTLTVVAGSWLVRVEAEGHALMWRSGKPTPLDADALEVAADVAVDFHLEPAPAWAIRGRVVDATGAPVARALVLAAPPDWVLGGARRPSAAAYTDTDGHYVLPVPTGAWLVATTLDWRGGALSWWGGNGSLSSADAVPVGDDARSDGIDLTLQP